MLQKPSLLYTVLFLFLLTLGLLGLVAFKKSPRKVIESTLKEAGYSDRMLKWLVAVSAFETNGWTSKVYRDSNNLFAMTLPTKNTTAIGKLPYGEGQAIYISIQASADDMVLYLANRFRYPTDFVNVEAMIAYMKQRGYFAGPEVEYVAGVKYWLNRVYGGNI